ncbi:MAG: hypothetical protein GIKADHBN_03454 [Phycisphaerales bacterium]|nr:hypothetical protein [Phycisphaerales bacterium]
MKLTGRPETSDSVTSFQSSSVVFSTIAQPCSVGLPWSLLRPSCLRASGRINR